MNPLMRFLVAMTRGWMIAIGITLPTREEEKAVAIIWVAAALLMILLMATVGWAVIRSMADSMTYR